MVLADLGGLAISHPVLDDFPLPCINGRPLDDDFWIHHLGERRLPQGPVFHVPAFFRAGCCRKEAQVRQDFLRTRGRPVFHRGISVAHILLAGLCHEDRLPFRLRIEVLPHRGPRHLAFSDGRQSEVVPYWDSGRLSPLYVAMLCYYRSHAHAINLLQPSFQVLFGSVHPSLLRLVVSERCWILRLTRGSRSRKEAEPCVCSPIHEHLGCPGGG
mmetsp:Transcript_18959/g.36674  ORF Transcript_18959/g.36674 Transcript_18959/m.36674 type:complete len:214 (+) Transcript_18959:1331-1972(+)